jgi:hypothetical protein
MWWRRNITEYRTTHPSTTEYRTKVDVVACEYRTKVDVVAAQYGVPSTAPRLMWWRRNMASAGC